MGIKNLRPNPNSKYKQGYFKNAKKYFGPEPIIYRSSLELSFIMKLELNPNVEKWSSESIQIPYYMKEMDKNTRKFVEKRHTYNIDFEVYLKNGDRYIIEVKPSSLSPRNEAQIKRDPIMYKNACKWRAAIAWCKLNNAKFRVITEQHLKTSVFS